MADKFALTPEEQAAIDAFNSKGGIEAVSQDELVSIAGGVIENGMIVVDMSEYHCVYYGGTMVEAGVLKRQGLSRDQAIQSIYDHYYSNGIRLDNLGQTITQNEWNRLN